MNIAIEYIKKKSEISVKIQQIINKIFSIRY